MYSFLFGSNMIFQSSIWKTLSKVFTTIILQFSWNCRSFQTWWAWPFLQVRHASLEKHVLFGSIRLWCQYPHQSLHQLASNKFCFLLQDLNTFGVESIQVFISDPRFKRVPIQNENCWNSMLIAYSCTIVEKLKNLGLHNFKRILEYLSVQNVFWHIFLTF